MAAAGYFMMKYPPATGGIALNALPVPWSALFYSNSAPPPPRYGLSPSGAEARLRLPGHITSSPEIVSGLGDGEPDGSAAGLSFIFNSNSKLVPVDYILVGIVVVQCCKEHIK